MHTIKPLTWGLLAVLVTRATVAESTVTAELDWLAGQWCAETGGEFIEEHWLPARGDLLLGLGRTIRDGRTVSFEFLRIERRGADVTYLAQPQGAAPTAFRMTASGTHWARFENPQHDFPKRVEYRLTPGGLHAEIAGPGKDGKEFVIPFAYRRCG